MSSLKPNVKVIRTENVSLGYTGPSEVVITELLLAESAFGVFHVGDILAVKGMSYRIVQRAISVTPISADQTLFLTLSVERAKP